MRGGTDHAGRPEQLHQTARANMLRVLDASPNAPFVTLILEQREDGQADARLNAAMTQADMLSAAAFIIEAVAQARPLGIDDLEAQRLAEHLVPVLNAMGLLPDAPAAPGQRLAS